MSHKVFNLVSLVFDRFYSLFVLSSWSLEVLFVVTVRLTLVWGRFLL